jgi:uncharacterized protein YecE (DUF72 family)
VILPDRLYVGAPVRGGSVPTTDHVEIGYDFTDLPGPDDVRAAVGKRTMSLLAWFVITHRRSDPRYKRMESPPPEHAAVGHFERSRWTDEAWEATDRLARGLDAKAIVLQTPASMKPTTEHATRLENFVAHAARPGLVIAWEPEEGSWPARKVLELADRIDAVPVIDPTQSAIPDTEYVYLRFRGGKSGRATLKDDDLKKVAIEVRDRIGWVIFSNSSAEQDAARFQAML